MLAIKGLRIAYISKRATVVAVDSLDLHVAEGEFFTLLGPSGCGKTSTLRAIAGLEVPTAGTIAIGDETVFSSERSIAVPAHRRDIGMGFQSYAIWPHMTVLENVSFPLRRGQSRSPKATAHERGMELLRLVQLDHLAARPATDLSGGQQQRVALARALVRAPKLLLLDEPLSNLDAKLRDTMRREIKEIVGRLGITTIYVTHDQAEALSMSDRVAVMSEGRLMQVETPRELYLHPENLFVSNFVGGSNVVRATVRAGGPATNGAGEADEWSTIALDGPEAWGGLHGAARGSLLDGQRVAVSFRPEAARLVSPRDVPPGDANVATGIVTGSLFSGHSVDYTVDVAGSPVAVRTDPFALFDVGTEVSVVVDAARCIVLAEDDGDPTDAVEPEEAEPPAAVLVASAAVTDTTGALSSEANGNGKG